MSRDIDLYLLDRVFQPAADALSGWISCFGLARCCLMAAVAAQTLVLVWDLVLPGGSTRFGLVVMATLAEYMVARAVQGRISRTEKQTRLGTANIARIALRPFRMSWIGVVLAGAGLWLSSGYRPVDLASVIVSLLWVLTAYFMCCVATPPRQSVHHSAWAFVPAGAH